MARSDSTTPPTLRGTVLLLEPNADHASLVQRSLGEAFSSPSCVHVSTQAQALHWLEHEVARVIIACVPDDTRDMQQVFRSLTEHGEGAPILALQSRKVRAQSSQLEKLGVTASLLKDRAGLSALPDTLAQVASQSKRRARKRADDPRVDKLRKATTTFCDLAQTQFSGKVRGTAATVRSLLTQIAEHTHRLGSNDPKSRSK